MSSSEERSLQEFWSQFNVDETACKSYVEHLEFLDAKAKKKVRERNALPSNIAWKNEKDVEALTNQPKMYLKQRDLKISGSMADFTKRVVSHARENASRDVLEDEEFNNSCEDDTISESESSDSGGDNSYVEESFGVLFVPEEDIQHVN